MSLHMLMNSVIFSHRRFTLMLGLDECFVAYHPVIQKVWGRCDRDAPVTCPGQMAVCPVTTRSWLDTRGVCPVSTRCWPETRSSVVYLPKSSESHRICSQPSSLPDFKQDWDQDAFLLVTFKLILLLQPDTEDLAGRGVRAGPTTHSPSVGDEQRTGFTVSIS
jgi:hypothetical protein